jgi:hypothetical protein
VFEAANLTVDLINVALVAFTFAAVVDELLKKFFKLLNYDFLLIDCLRILFFFLLFLFENTQFIETLGI